jgi:hypothetical protein
MTTAAEIRAEIILQNNEVMSQIDELYQRLAIIKSELFAHDRAVKAITEELQQPDGTEEIADDDIEYMLMNAIRETPKSLIEISEFTGLDKYLISRLLEDLKEKRKAHPIVSENGDRKWLATLARSSR